MTQEIAIQSETDFPKFMTADELLKISDDGYRYELVKGELRKMAPAGSEHGILIVKLTWRLAQHVERHGLGVVFAAETGFRIESAPDTVRAPDIAFVRQAHIPDTGIPKGYWQGAPDLAVEVISPSDTYVEVEDKVFDWINAGTSMVWVVNPRRRTVTVQYSLKDFILLTEEDELDGGDVIEGFQCRVSEIFA
jgi:Uma2 family endonuclease